jgi:cation:H+ antiporter
MDAWIYQWMGTLTLPVLCLVIAGCIYTLGKGADLLVEEAVTVSIRWGVPRFMIGATIVSLGTTFPEAVVSVWAAVKGRPGIALGNAVGSIICDTGLILGLATVISPPPLMRRIVDRQGRLQLAAGFLLVISCIPFCCVGNIFSNGGMLPRQMGFVFLLLLLIYLWTSIYWVKDDTNKREDSSVHSSGSSSGGWIAMRFVAALGMILVSSHVLIPAVQDVAVRIGVPESIVSATLVAFGTSLPELFTAVTAVRKGHGDLAVGNVIGADILNVLFVAGAAASVTKGGLAAPAHFFQVLFPAMLFVLVVFRVGVNYSKTNLQRPFGVVLLVSYVFSTVISYSYLIL